MAGQNLGWALYASGRRNEAGGPGNLQSVEPDNIPSVIADRRLPRQTLADERRETGRQEPSLPRICPDHDAIVFARSDAYVAVYQQQLAELCLHLTMPVGDRSATRDSDRDRWMVAALQQPSCQDASRIADFTFDVERCWVTGEIEIQADVAGIIVRTAQSEMHLGAGVRHPSRRPQGQARRFAQNRLL